MKPTIGRIVHFKHENGSTYPAIITTVFSDNCVNLSIFNEQTVALVKTSVILGDDINQWNWPKREE